MATILIPIDGSPSSYRAIIHASGRRNRGEQFEAIIVTVLPEANHKMSPELAKQQRDAELNGMLADAMVANHVRILGAKSRVLLGDVAPSIAAFATQAHCTEIIMGTRGLSPISTMLMGSVANKMLHLVQIPITFVR